MTRRLLVVPAALLAGAALAVLATPATASSEETRVLLLVPRGDVALAAHTARLEEAIRTVRGPIRLVESLSSAEVVVELMEYRRDVTKDGQPLRKWIAQYALVSPRHLTGQSMDAPQKFQLVVVGPDGDALARAVELLERALRQATGPAIDSPLR